MKETADRENDGVKGLRLRPMDHSDGDTVCRWMTSSYILQHSFVVAGPHSRPYDFATREYAMRYFRRLLGEKRRLTFAITFDGGIIGSIGLKEISALTNSAECFIEIGEPKWRGCGLGTEAMAQLLDKGFHHLALERIDLEVLEFNFPAIKMYHYLGFISLGHGNWHYDEFGQYWSVLRMSLSKDMWQASLRQRNLAS